MSDDAEAGRRERLERLEKRVDALSKRLYEVERPESYELLGRRWAELKELVEYVSVATRTDVLANVIGSLRQNKRDVEKALVAAGVAAMADQAAAERAAADPAAAPAAAEDVASAARGHAGRAEA